MYIKDTIIALKCHTPSHLFPCTVVCLMELNRPRESADKFGDRDPMIWPPVSSLTGPRPSDDRRSAT